MSQVPGTAPLLQADSQQHSEGRSRRCMWSKGVESRDVAVTVVLSYFLLWRRRLDASLPKWASCG